MSDAVGLAVSGGGIRSAAFSLGVIQSFYEKGLLRYFDYLSTVSGGSYVGVFLTSLALHPQTKMDWKPGSESSRRVQNDEHDITLARDTRHRQPADVRRVIYGGNYLNRPLLFLNSWLPGYLIVNLFVAASTIAICAFAAWLFRSMYQGVFDRVLSTLGFSDDVTRAYFPAALMLLFWMAYFLYLAAVQFLGNRDVDSTSAKGLTLALVITVLLSTISLIGVGDIDTKVLTEQFHLSISPTLIAQFQFFGQWLLYSILAVAVVPYLSPAALLRSGAKQNNIWYERTAFRLATSALFWGVPLVIFGVLAGENISQANRGLEIQSRLHAEQITDWTGFWSRLEAGDDLPLPHDWPNTTAEIDQTIWSQFQGVQSAVLKDPDFVSTIQAGTPAEVLQRVTTLKNYRDYNIRNESISNRLSSGMQYLVVGKDGAGEKFGEQIENLWELKYLQPLAMAYLNYVVADPNFHRVFRNYMERIQVAPKDEAPANREELLAAYHAALRLSDGNSRVSESLNLWRSNELLESEKIARKELSTDPISTKNQKESDPSKSPPPSLSPIKSSEQLALQQERDQLILANLRLFRAFYGPNLIAPADAVYYGVVGKTDQDFRLWLALRAALFTLVLGCILNLNRTSLHGYYRDQLASVWVRRPDGGQQLKLVDLKTSQCGAPYLLMNCALSFLHQDDATREETAPFLLSRRACGSSRLGFARTEEFESGGMKLDDAMAISGAAITPALSSSLAVRVLMLLFNMRLGQWLMNPAISSLQQAPPFYRHIWRRPQPLHLILSRLLVSEQMQDYHFVSDGGLHENLGIEPLFERRCRVIVAIDSGADPKGKFEDLVKLLLRARVQHGIEIIDVDRTISLDLQSVAGVSPLSAQDKLGAVLRDALPAAGAKTGKDKSRKQHFIVARIKYPGDNEPSWLLYIRPGFNGDEPAELDRFAKQFLDFPNDSTLDQFYSSSRFEAYRLLGHHIGRDVCRQVFSPITGSAPPLTEGSDGAKTSPKDREDFLKQRKDLRERHSAVFELITAYAEGRNHRPAPKPPTVSCSNSVGPPPRLPALAAAGEPQRESSGSAAAEEKSAAVARLTQKLWEAGESAENDPTAEHRLIEIGGELHSLNPELAHTLLGHFLRPAAVKQALGKYKKNRKASPK